jgi:hypothetical protein
VIAICRTATPTNSGAAIKDGATQTGAVTAPGAMTASVIMTAIAPAPGVQTGTGAAMAIAPGVRIGIGAAMAIAPGILIGIGAMMAIAHASGIRAGTGDAMAAMTMEITTAGSAANITAGIKARSTGDGAPVIIRAIGAMLAGIYRTVPNTS